MTVDRWSEPIPISAEWAARYLERLEQPFDDWQADFFRRGCGFLARGVIPGAESCWRSMTVPPDHRPEIYAGPIAARALTAEEIGRIRGMLLRIVQAETPQAERSEA
jgi:hypothetical protein